VYLRVCVGVGALSCPADEALVCVCAYVCVCVCVYLCVGVFMCALSCSTDEGIGACVCIYMLVYLCVCVLSCQADKGIGACACVRVCVYLCFCMCLCVCMHVQAFASIAKKVMVSKASIIHHVSKHNFKAAYIAVCLLMLCTYSEIGALNPSRTHSRYLIS
jgi:hypothetical protein